MKVEVVAGVGFSVRRSDINELPKVKHNVSISHQKTNDADYIVPDSREGWVKLLSLVLNSFFKSGEGFSYSTVLVRPAGTPIRGFGGTASGPQVLVDGIEKICSVLSSRAGKKLRSIDVLDICNIIGMIVVAGNVRRSAEIALGDADDLLFLRAKRWDLGNIPNHRAMSNNTIYADSYEYTSPEFWSGYTGNGEPYGLVNLALSQTTGRLGEYVEDTCEGFNPCGEVTLANYESCNLCELFLNNITSVEELKDISVLLYKTQKAISQMPYRYKESEQVIHKNSRLGQGVTGICQSLEKLDWLDEAYKHLKEFDKEWSRLRGWNESIKLTTIKPSGTLSLLAGATPGVHPAFSQYYIRRVRMSSADPLVEVCKQAGYKVEPALHFDGSKDATTSVVEFPCTAGHNVITARDMTAIQQLELVKKLQTLWSDNAVSVTVYYRPEELESIQEWLQENYETSIKSVSFLLHSEHGFVQAPYEEITQEQYTSLLDNILPITTNLSGDVLLDDCVGGACPVR